MEKNSSPIPQLFQPLTLRSVTLRNRIGVSPMCQYSATDGVANDWHFAHLGSRAVGGAGIVIVEATGVAPEGRITPGCLGLWNEKQIEPLARIAHFVKTHGAVAGIQIAHAGRKASAALPWQGGAHLSDAQGGWETIAPSAIAFGGDLQKIPRAMTEADILRVQNDFVATAKRALTAGFEFLELHAAHGYLFNEFLSPLANQRTDQYGGSFANRTRLLLDTTRAVRKIWPDHLPLAVRISAIDWKEGGLQFRRRGARRENHRRAGLPSAVRGKSPARRKYPHCRRRLHHRAKTSRGHHRSRPGRFGLAGATILARPVLACARGAHARLQNHAAESIRPRVVTRREFSWTAFCAFSFFKSFGNFQRAQSLTLCARRTSMS